MKAWETTVILVALCLVVPAAGALDYRDVAEEAGVDVQQVGEIHPGPNRDNVSRDDWPAFPEIMGPGVCFADFTGNGYDDLYVPRQRWNPKNPATDDWSEGLEPRNRLYENRGDGNFTDITQASKAGSSAFSYGCSAADYDADGDVDLHVTNFGANELFENTGNGTFVNATREAGVGGRHLCGEYRCMSTSSAWGDYDEDGDLDLYVANYVETDLADEDRGPIGHTSQQNFLYENQGDGTFVERGQQAGVVGPRAESQFGSKSLGVVWFDHDGDGDLDLYVANDVSTNDLYVNEGDGTFREASSDSRTADTRASMGVTAQDYDQDGYTDLFFTHYSDEHNGFYHNWPANGTYQDRSGEDGLDADFPKVSWGTRFFDADRDGDLDLLTVSGHTEWDAEDYGQSTQLFSQSPDADTPQRNSHWTDITRNVNLDQVDNRVSRGAAFADIDYDGDTDVAIGNNANQSLQLLEAANVTNNALSIRLDQATENPNAIGARVTVEAGSISQTQVLRAGSSYLSQNSLALNFGLGDHETADLVTVEWPDGTSTTYQDVPAEGVVRLERETGKVVRDTIPPGTSVTIDGERVDGWFPEPVTVEVQASDRGTSVVSGVTELRTAIDDGAWTQETTYTLETGVHEIHATATDAAGNVQPRDTTVLGVDAKAPQHLAHTVNGTLGANGWYTSDVVNVTLDASDDLSGVERIEYRLDGANWTNYTGPIPIGEDGEHTVAYRAIDRAGNPSTIERFELRLDATEPAIALERPGPGHVYVPGASAIDLLVGPAHLLVGPNSDEDFEVRAMGQDATSGLAELRLDVNDTAHGEPRSASPAMWLFSTDRPAGLYELGLSIQDRAGNLATLDRALVLHHANSDGLERTLDEGPSLHLDPGTKPASP